MSSISDIVAAEREMFDKAWYGRSDKNPTVAHPQLGDLLVQRILLAAQKRVEDQYGYEKVQKGNPF